jgi:hypothetical protein
MAQIEKTVFISYRRTNFSWSVAIYKDLTYNGYDVFFDYKGIASGDFESIILENVRARAHFLVLLTPSALKRCSQAGDWVRREIETAIEAKRNIVPVMLPGFKFGSPTITRQLTGKLEPLSKYNALNVPIDYFDGAMGRLRGEFLNVALDAVSHPASSRAQNAAKKQQAAADTAPAARKEKLRAETYFEQGFSAMDPDEKIRLYTEAIRLKPDLRGAMADYEASTLTGTEAKQSKAHVASKTVSSAPSRQKDNHERKSSIPHVHPEKKPDIQTEARRLFEEPRELRRAKESERKIFTRQKAEEKQPRADGKDERGQKKLTTAQDMNEERVLEPRRRKHAQAASHTQPAASTKQSKAVRASQRGLRAAQNAAADRELARIRRERREEAESRKLEKEKPLQAWLKRLLNRPV